MFRLIALLVVFSLCGVAANDLVREVTSEATRADHQLVPAFYRGYFYWIGLAGPANQLTIYAPDGHLRVEENAISCRLFLALSAVSSFVRV